MNATQRVTQAGDGFLVAAPGEQSTQVKWSQIQEIIAFKRDLFAYDEICLALSVDGIGCIEISEETEGFADLMQAMDKQLTGVRANWFNDVMVPAFAECRTVIYSRKPQSR